MEQGRGGGGERMEVGEAGPLKHSVQWSPCQSFEAQAPQWPPLAGREEVMGAPLSRISRWKEVEITETRDMGSPIG